MDRKKVPKSFLQNQFSSKSFFLRNFEAFPDLKEIFHCRRFFENIKNDFRVKKLIAVRGPGVRQDEDDLAEHEAVRRMPILLRRDSWTRSNKRFTCLYL